MVTFIDAIKAEDIESLERIITKIADIGDISVLVLHEAIVYNKPKVVEWIYDRTPTKDLWVFPGPTAIQMAVGSRQLDILKMLGEKTKPAHPESPLDLNERNNVFNPHHNLVIAAGCGYWDIMEWYFDEFEIDQESILHDNRILRTAADAENFDLIERLITWFNIDVEEIVGGMVSVWDLAVTQGRLDFLQWADGHYKLDQLMATYNSDAGIQLAKKNNHENVAIWLMGRFGLKEI